LDQTDSLVLELPRVMPPGIGRELLTGQPTAGASAAFISTASGLTIAIAGDLGGDVTRRSFGGVRVSGSAACRVGACLAVVVPALLAFATLDIGVARMVGLAFAVAASTFCPLLVLGIWWQGLTAPGAVAGLVVGGLGSGVAV